MAILDFNPSTSAPIGWFNFGLHDETPGILNPIVETKEFLSDIWDLLETAFSMLVNSLKMTIIFLKGVFDSLRIPTEIITYLPNLLGVAIITFFTMSVVKAVIGR